MPETRRFLRYVIPGLVFVTELLLLRLLVHPPDIVIALAALKDADGLGVVAATILASGGLGFLFSVLHHAVLWFSPGAALDYKRLVRSLVGRKALRLRDLASGDSLEDSRLDELTRADAWVIVTSLWNERTASSLVKAADSKVMAMTDLVHSTGSALVASWGAVAGALLLGHSWSVRGLLGLAAGVSIIVVHWISHRTVSNLTVAMISAVLSDAVKPSEPQEMHITLGTGVLKRIGRGA